jgi:hypothetical protein
VFFPYVVPTDTQEGFLFYAFRLSQVVLFSVHQKYLKITEIKTSISSFSPLIGASGSDITTPAKYRLLPKFGCKPGVKKKEKYGLK